MSSLFRGVEFHSDSAAINFRIEGPMQGLVQSLAPSTAIALADTRCYRACLRKTSPCRVFGATIAINTGNQLPLFRARKRVLSFDADLLTATSPARHLSCQLPIPFSGHIIPSSI